MSDRETRDAAVDRWADELRAIAKDELGDNDDAVSLIEFPMTRVQSWAERFREKANGILVSAYLAGRGGIDRMRNRDWDTVATLIDAQDRYATGFVADVLAGELSVAQVAARSALYAGAGVNAWERGAAADKGAAADGLLPMLGFAHDAGSTAGAT